MKKQKLLVAFIEHLDKVGALGYDHCFNFEESAAEFLRKRKQEKGMFGLKNKRDLSKEMILNIEDLYKNAGYIIRGKSTPFIYCTVTKNERKATPDIATIEIRDGFFKVETSLSYFLNKTLLSKMIEPELTAQQIYKYMVEALDVLKAKIG